MMDPILERDELYRDARLGDGFERFMESEQGIHLARRIEEEEREAELEFRTVNAKDAGAVYDIQNRLKVCDLLRKFIYESIESGRIAMATLMEEEFEDE